MDYQRKTELEDGFIERNGRHPLWVYEREIKRTESVSYEDFLFRTTSGFDQAEQDANGAVVLYEAQEEITEDAVDISGFWHCAKKKSESSNAGQFDSFSNIDQALIKRISDQLGRPAYGLFKKIREFSVDEWKHDSKAFFEWLEDEMAYSSGKDLVQLDPMKPYGPDNCMLGGLTQELFRRIDERHHADFRMMYQKMRIEGNPAMLSNEWKTLPSFLRWLQRHESMIPDYAIMLRLDPEKPYGPDNCRFTDCGCKKSTSRNTFLYHAPLEAEVRKIGKRYGANPLAKYNSLSAGRLLDTQVWPLKDYLEWVISQAANDEFAPYLNRLDKSMPYEPGNCYYSWRALSIATHGMTNTKLYRKYRYFVKYYKEKLEHRATFEEFMESALTVKDYQLNSRMRVHACGEYVTLDDIEFISNDDDLADINRICSIYEAIPENENQFGGLMDFMEWTIRRGYQSWMDFKKVGNGPYSKKTCVWDIFTEAGYIASKGHRMLEIFQRQNK